MTNNIKASGHRHPQPCPEAPKLLSIAIMLITVDSIDNRVHSNGWRPWYGKCVWPDSWRPRRRWSDDDMYGCHSLQIDCWFFRGRAIRKCADLETPFNPRRRKNGGDRGGRYPISGKLCAGGLSDHSFTLIQNDFMSASFGRPCLNRPKNCPASSLYLDYMKFQYVLTHKVLSIPSWEYAMQYSHKEFSRINEITCME